MSEVIETIKEKPDDIYTFFNVFADILIKQTMWSEGTKMEIMELGPREKLWSRFQLFPVSGAQFSFNVAFEISADIIEVMYEYKIEFLLKMPFKKMITKIAKKTINPQVISLIIKSLNETKKKLKEEITSEGVKPISTDDPLKLLKLKMINGEISEEEYIRKKKLLED